MKKLIIFDIDGTAVDSPSKKIPSQRLIKQIERLSTKFLIRNKIALE
jgi:hydroxymethylpyrimidine pyrophosphatase-like HAD family hydrolase